MSKRNLMIVQGGGPTAVFNTSLATIISEAQHSRRFEAIYGASFGVHGLTQGNVVDLTRITPIQLEQLRCTPGAALGTSRHSPTQEESEALYETLDNCGAGAVLFIGGNGTMRGAKLVSEGCRSRGLDVAVIGVPKTVDNDLAFTDRCPGYASAARYAAIAAQELAADVCSLRQPVTIFETLGRNVGWIAAATVLSREDAQGKRSAPHVICIPEVPFDEDEFLAHIDNAVRAEGWAIAVVAEGIRFRDDSLVYQTSASGQADPLQRPMTGGVARHLATRVSERLELRCRSEIPGLLGRASMRCVAQRDVDDAVVVGRAGVAALAEGARDVMVSLDPLTDNVSRTSLKDLDQASGEERDIPQAWLRKGSIPVTEDFITYLRPLVGPLDSHITEFGDPVRLGGRVLQ